jgi:hypothetical protein
MSDKEYVTGVPSVSAEYSGSLVGVSDLQHENAQLSTGDVGRYVYHYTMSSLVWALRDVIRGRDLPPMPEEGSEI